MLSTCSVSNVSKNDDEWWNNVRWDLKLTCNIYTGKTETVRRWRERERQGEIDGGRERREIDTQREKEREKERENEREREEEEERGREWENEKERDREREVILLSQITIPIQYLVQKSLFPCHVPCDLQQSSITDTDTPLQTNSKKWLEWKQSGHSIFFVTLRGIRYACYFISANVIFLWRKCTNQVENSGPATHTAIKINIQFSIQINIEFSLFTSIKQFVMLRWYES